MLDAAGIPAKNARKWIRVAKKYSKAQIQRMYGTDVVVHSQESFFQASES